MREKTKVTVAEQNRIGRRSVQPPIPTNDRNFSLDNIISLPSPKNSKFLIGRSLVSLGVAAVCFLLQLTVVSHVQYESAQFKATETIRYELANGTAPVGQVDRDGKLLAAGTPVAVIKIAKLGVEDVVLEGTTSSITMSGPGHRRDTVLPGQAGISVLFGRQSSYSGVFARLADLKPGDKIETTTGQGVSTYTVEKIRRAGDPATNQIGSSKGRLTLVTTSGLPFFAADLIRVEATLDGEPRLTPNRVIPNSAIRESEFALASDLSALTPLIFLTQFLILLIIGVGWLARRWGQMQAWIAGTPVFAIFTSLWSTQLIQLLPNLL